MAGTIDGREPAIAHLHDGAAWVIDDPGCAERVRG